MRDTLLALLLAMPPQAPQPPQAPPAWPDPPEVRPLRVAPRPLPKASAPRPSLPQHSHRCPFDGTVWSHDDRSFGNADAHRCPTCGRLVWQIHSRGPAPAPRALAPVPLGGGWYGPAASISAPCPPGRT